MLRPTAYGSENNETEEFLSKMTALAVPPKTNRSKPRGPFVLCATFLIACAAGALGYVAHSSSTSPSIATESFSANVSSAAASNDILFPWQSVSFTLPPPTPIVANWTAIDSNADGSISLNELLGYLSTKKDAQIQIIRDAANAAIEEVKAKFEEHSKCITAAYDKLVDSKSNEKNEILTANELKTVLRYAQDQCHDLFTPTPTTTITTTPTPGSSPATPGSTTPTPESTTQTPGSTTQTPGPTTQTSESPTPTPDPNTNPEEVKTPSPTTTTAVPTTTSWVEPPTPNVTKYTPSRQEVLVVMQSSLDILRNGSNLTKEYANVVLNQTLTNLTAQINSAWFNTEAERKNALSEVAKYMGSMNACVNIAILVFGHRVNALDAFELAPAIAWVKLACMDLSNKDFGNTDTNENNVVEEAEVLAAIAKIRDAKIASLVNITNPAAYQTTFFATRQMYSKTMECAHEGITQLGDPVERTLTREQFYGLEAWMTGHCSNVQADESIHGLPNATDLGGNYSLDLIKKLVNQARDSDLASIPKNDTLHAATVDDHYNLVQACLEATYSSTNTTNHTTYSSLVENVKTCMSQSLPLTVPVEILLSRPEFQALLELTWASETTKLDVQIQQAQAALDKLKAKKKALADCIIKAVDNAARGGDQIKQSELVPAQGFTKQCYLNATA